MAVKIRRKCKHVFVSLLYIVTVCVFDPRGSRHGSSPPHLRPRPHPSWSDQRAPQDRPIAFRGPGPSASLGSQICVWCRVFVIGIGDSLMLGEFLEWFCVGLVICLCRVVLEVFLCSVGVLVRLCLFLMVFYSIFFMGNCLHAICDDLRCICAVFVFIVSGGVSMLVV